MKKTTFIIAFSLAMQAMAVKQIRKNEVLKFLGLIVINLLDLILTKSLSGACQLKSPKTLREIKMKVYK